MKILIICSKAFYPDIEPIKTELEKAGHVVELPNSYYEPDAEKNSWALGEKEHAEFKARMFRMSEERIAKMDAVLTLNFDKNGKKIFEGDIVKDEQSGYEYVIKWFPEYACFALANKNGHMEYDVDEFEMLVNDLIVIGTIHDDSDLLEVSK